MKSSNLNSEKLYVEQFHIADKNYILFLSDEKMNELRKRNHVEEKKKMHSKKQVTQKVYTQAQVWIGEIPGRD